MVSSLCIRLAIKKRQKFKKIFGRCVETWKVRLGVKKAIQRRKTAKDRILRFFLNWKAKRDAEKAAAEEAAAYAEAMKKKKGKSKDNKKKSKKKGKDEGKEDKKKKSKKEKNAGDATLAVADDAMSQASRRDKKAKKEHKEPKVDLKQ